MASNRNVTIKVPVLARVEGEGSLELEVRDGGIASLRLRIFEPPRFFEKFLEGRAYHEVPDAVARICGICPVAYQMSAVQALESIFAVDVGDWALRMRRAMYCGEWLQSHALHIHLLAAPDYLGYASAIDMAADHPELLNRGLRLQALGNDLISLFGGRSVHPVGVCVGGFHRAPDADRVDSLLHRLRDARDEARGLLEWAASLALPADQQAFTSVALAQADDYAIYTGEIRSDGGLTSPVEGYEAHFREHHETHSTALYSLLDGQPYLVGPLARMNLNGALLRAEVRETLARTAVRFPSRNMFLSLVARAAEVYHSLLEAIDLLSDYRPPADPKVPVTPCAGVGFGASEAPRGLLWHRYETDDNGRIVNARIVPPTSQNQARIEQDLRASLIAYGLDRPDEALRLRAETAIRNYDPCISCATHFLRLTVNR